MKYRLFLDDERFPVESDWKIARSNTEAMLLVKLYGLPYEISFDHDLGDDETSMFFIHWMIDRVLDKMNAVPENFSFSVHSRNPVGTANINGLMNNFLYETRPTRA